MATAKKVPNSRFPRKPPRGNGKTSPKSKTGGDRHVMNTKQLTGNDRPSAKPRY